MTSPQHLGGVEVLDVVDEHDHVIGRAPRSTVYLHRLRHRCVFILVRDKADRILVHRRPAHKALFPSRYDMFVGGAVAAGESYDQAARREAAEELGVRGPLPEPQPLWRFLYETIEHAWWCAIYSLRYDGPVDPPAAELSWHSFFTEAELHQRLNDWPWALDSLEAYQRLRKARSAG